ncbi:hdaD, histone deacetylase family protein [Tieghemostelium lacteum]|uniref:histone deacetylase n=1 Tax=Tieghemostelium lacteum TaxID=361077 RepID=A0A152A8G7_TIELA|nr:hdaD, histone deacetylase family protein [Tieghemostelium lacteum]|eukprot:KYR02367.1 hdaD, histone deacetylase family protein [Tieghemostelium lacteum]
MMTLHQSVSDPQRLEKPECCITAARGHCTIHCPRIEDVLYSQRKGKTNKGAQRWRCKACGTKWTSKQSLIPPVVPDTMANSIGYGNGPEEISMDLRGVRPYKKSRTIVSNGIGDGMISSPFSTNLYGSNISPSHSPIPSPPSPSPLSGLLSSAVPNSRQINQPPQQGIISALSSLSNSNSNSLGSSNNFVPILPTSSSIGSSSTNSSSSSISRNTPINNHGNSSTIKSQNITTKPVVVGAPSPSQSATPSLNNSLNSTSSITQKSSSLLPMPFNTNNSNTNINSNQQQNSIPLPGSQQQLNSAHLNQRSTTPSGNRSSKQSSQTSQGGLVHQPPLSPKSIKIANMFNNYMATNPNALVNAKYPPHIHASTIKASKSSPMPKVPNLYTSSSTSSNASSSSAIRNVPDYQSPPTPQPTQQYRSTPSASDQVFNMVDPYMYEQHHHQQAHHHPHQSNHPHYIHSQGNLHFQYLTNQQISTYTPSSNLVECFKKLLLSFSIFIGEYTVDNRLKLNSFLQYIQMPSTETLFNNSIARNLLAPLDNNCFKISKHYQSLYSVVSKHLSMMEDPMQPIAKVYFDENEIYRLLVFLDHHKSIEDIFELILQDVQSYRESLIQKREQIESTLMDPGLSTLANSQNNNSNSSNSNNSNQQNSNLSNQNSNSSSTPNNENNLEKTKAESSRVLDTLAPLETTLSHMESKLRSTQKDLIFIGKIFGIVELLYGIHAQHHQLIIEKHSKTVQNYIVDVIQQTLYNADVLSNSYNKMKLTISNNASLNGKRLRDEDDQGLIDTNNPFINSLYEVLSKFDTRSSTNATPTRELLRERKVLAVYHTLCLDHNVPDEHPESPKRLSSVISAINELYQKFPEKIVIKNDPEEAQDKWILTVHSPDYLRQLDEITEKLDLNEIRALNAPDGANSSTGGASLTINANQDQTGECEDGDTFISKLSLKAAKRSAGATISAIDHVFKGTVSSAFVAARPPGHHAGRDGLTSGTSSQGFCLLNNVCIGAKYAQLKYNLERIAIIDIDVHHGNGTEEIVANDNGFLFCSIHMFEEGFYPGSGAASQSVNTLEYQEESKPLQQQQQLNTNISTNNNIVNIPLDPKSSAVSFLKAFSIIIDRLNDYQPELLMISCGFDAHQDDHLASLCLTDENYIEITKQLRIVADRWAKGRIISVLEGGYNISALKQCTIAHLMSLYDD